MICLKERVAHYKGAKINQLLEFGGHTYVRLAITDLRAVDNGIAQFRSICQRVDETFNDLELRLESTISATQVAKNVCYKQIPVGQFGQIDLGDGRQLFVRIKGISDVSWNATDLEYHYLAELIKPMSQLEVQRLLNDQRRKRISSMYTKTDDTKVVRLTI